MDKVSLNKTQIEKLIKREDYKHTIAQNIAMIRVLQACLGIFYKDKVYL